jgi:hypothetical protein
MDFEDAAANATNENNLIDFWFHRIIWQSLLSLAKNEAQNEAKENALSPLCTSCFAMWNIHIAKLYA